uniref:Secreted protein n=2 Tax=Heterorhabditis bacteriophora TaxID=37862 RepID=A0A1I7X3G0_HETBA
MEPAGTGAVTTPLYARTTTTRSRFQLFLFWMAIVAEHSIGRVWQEEGERNGDTSESRRGTDPALLSRFRMIYPTGPLQHVPIVTEER